jgi:hypothetical protein
MKEADIMKDKKLFKTSPLRSIDLNLKVEAKPNYSNFNGIPESPHWWDNNNTGGTLIV